MTIVSTRAATADHVMLRKAEAYTVLDEICQCLELTTTQYGSAKNSYETVAQWLADGDDPALRGLSIYAHGSTALGTTVKPIRKDEHDVDLICHVPNFRAQRSPADLKKLVGDRLREHGTYASILEEKKRCWRLNYAREFHLDISPTIPNAECSNGGELVPDRHLRVWKPTNPKGYRVLFDERAKLVPRLRIQNAGVQAQDIRTSVETFPSQSARKGILRRTVQVLKRHRDIMFQDTMEDVAPISIIITTLAAQAYQFCVTHFEFDTELDVVYETIRMMPHFIEHPVVLGKRIFLVSNESTHGENFAERWNSEPERARAFDRWHARALGDFEGIASIEGIDLLTERLERALGSTDVRKTMEARISAISNARATKQLYVAPAVGLTFSNSARATAVPGNTFFGD